MPEEKYRYIAIDLKSFYASIECRERGLDPLTTNLVVADVSRTEKTICLAVSPSLKAYGISGRARLFEVVQRVKEVNRKRLLQLGRLHEKEQQFAGDSYDATELEKSPELALSYIAAPPRMALYVKYSTWIYEVYLKYIAPEDIHVYSIDEVFLDVSHYLRIYRMSVRELAGKIVKDVFETTGITATAGIGTNLYLCKVAMDIVAKHAQPDKNGVRIAQLDEMSYRRLLWDHKPLTDFWRVGRGYAKKLAEAGIYTMGDIAKCSIGRPNEFYNEELLYKFFGVNAELLIDHAWGYEPCTIKEIKAYKPQTNSICMGQVLQCPYHFTKGRLIVREMTDMLALDLVEKRLVTDQLVLTVGYDIENLSDEKIRANYRGKVTTDRYGRKVPEHAHGTANIDRPTSSSRLLTDAVLELYDRIVNKELYIRRVNVTANRVVDENFQAGQETYEQLELFADNHAQQEKEKEQTGLIKERKLQEAMLAVKKRYGKNAILKGTSLEEGATARDRNGRIGGHKA